VFLFMASLRLGPMYYFITVALTLQLVLAPAQPAPAGGQQAAQALLWLRTQQLPDGSFGVRLTQGRFAPSASVTADAVYVLALHGEDPSGPGWTQNGTSLLDALAALAPDYTATDAGQAGKVARAVAAAGANPRAFGGVDLIARIQSAYDSQSGRYHPTSLFRHTLAVEGLWWAGEPVPAAAVQALLDAQLDDGGWSWSFDGARSDVDTTGRVLQVMAGQLGVREEPALTEAALYLCRQQQSDAGWGVGNVAAPSNANSTALAVAGLRAAGYDPAGPAFRRNGRTAIFALRSFQETGGAFVYLQQPGKEESRAMATIDALTALAQSLSRPEQPLKPGCRLPERWRQQPDNIDHGAARDAGHRLR